MGGIRTRDHRLSPSMPGGDSRDCEPPKIPRTMKHQRGHHLKTAAVLMSIHSRARARGRGQDYSGFHRWGVQDREPSET